jgi:large subunit ribosomal protein L36e
MSSRGIALGLKKGFQITKVDKRRKVAATKGKRGPRSKLAREVAREVSGWAPYEKRVMEYLRNGLDKRALRLARRRLGTHQRGKRKRDELADAIRQEALLKQLKKDQKEKDTK